MAFVHLSPRYCFAALSSFFRLPGRHHPSYHTLDLSCQALLMMHSSTLVPPHPLNLCKKALSPKRLLFCERFNRDASSFADRGLGVELGKSGSVCLMQIMVEYEKKGDADLPICLDEEDRATNPEVYKSVEEYSTRTKSRKTVFLVDMVALV